MQFTRNSYLKINKNLFPKPIFIIFVVILFASFYSLMRDMQSSGLRPFGQLSDIFAAVTTGSSLSSKTAAAASSNDYQIIDSWGRCLVTNPNAKKPIVTVAESGYSAGGVDVTSKAGINQGSGFGDAGTQLDFIRAAGLNMSYIVGLATSPDEAGAAANFVKEVSEAGKMPIIRLCYSGGCQFNLEPGAGDIIRFYSEINNQLEGTDYEFVGVVGPNEPGTSTPLEALGFFPSIPGDSGDSAMESIIYPTLVRRANEAAEALQDFRADYGGHMYIAPAIFNASNTTHDDVMAYLYSGNPINPDLFDFILANTYNLQEGTAAFFYDQPGRSIRKFVEDNGLYTIFTEFGYFPNSGGEAALKSSYRELCEDDTVDGILFFRPDYPELPASPPRQEPPIDSKVLDSIISTCSKEPTKFKSKSSAWLNCNFDSCVSKEYKYSPRSIAAPVTPIIKTTTTGSTPPGSSTPGTPSASCNANAYSIFSSTTVNTIAKSGKSTDRVILIGDSQTFNDPLPNAINFGQPSASSYWFLGNDPIDPTNPAKVKAKNDFEASLNANAFAAVIMLGTNDCGGVNIKDFENNLTSIALEYAGHGIIPILSTFPERNIEVAKTKGIPGCVGETDSFNALIRTIASAHGWPLRDGNQMVTLSQLDPTDGLHINDYSCLDAGTINLLEKLKDVISGATTGDDDSNGGSFSLPSQNSQPKAWLKINCSGGTCDTKQVNTLQSWLPIKSLGSATATNSTKYRSYTPSCVELATQVRSDQYDLLNQFAGKLSSGGTVYPMPWLGSLINCLSEMSNYTKDFAGQIQLQTDYNPHPFSKITESTAESKSDLKRDLAKSPINLESVNKIYEELKNNEAYIPDERSICIKDKVKNKETCYDSSAINTLKLYRPYDAFSVPTNWYSLDYKSVTGTLGRMIYLRNSDDLLPGPEVNAGTTTNTYSAGDLCRRYGIRKIDDDTKNNFRFKGDLDCEVDENAIWQQYEAVPGNPATKVTIYCGSYFSGVSDGLLKSESYMKGELDFLKDTEYSKCFIYHPQGNDLIEHVTQDYATAPKYNIEGAYDALFKEYTRLQTQMSQRNKKIVFLKDIGWEAKSDSIIRDGNKSVDLGDYLYKGEYDSAICENVSLFDNKSSKARGTPVKSTKVYYSHLGALEPMQEWIDVYTNSSNLPGESEIENPFYDLNDPLKPNNDRKTILVSGTINTASEDYVQLPASLTNNFPLLTCDQVKIGEKYTNEELYAAIRPKYSNAGLSADQIAILDKKVHGIANLMYPFQYKLEAGGSAACVANKGDLRYKDEMASFLCKSGYSVEGVCKSNYQCSITSDPNAPKDPGSTLGTLDQLQNGLVELTHKIENVMCVNPGMLIAMMEREITSGIGGLTGDPFQQVYPRRSSAVAWGPAAFTNIAWVAEGFGHIGTKGFENIPYSTKRCLDALGISYSTSNPSLFEDVGQGILDRTYVGYALCGSAAFLKYTSQTNDKCTGWTKEEVERAAKSYLGACSENGRSYCDIYSKTICNIYPLQNSILCGNSGNNLALSCTDPGGLNNSNCNDGIVRVINPLKDKASEAIITQDYGVNGHNAIDYGISQGTPIYAAASGTIVKVQRNWSPCPPNATPAQKLECDAGNFMKIKTQTGDRYYWTLYEHLQSVIVNLGDTVNAGQLIGYSGNTGNSSGPHLHFELRLVDCYDGLGTSALGTCSADPKRYYVTDEGLLQCVNTGGDALITGDFACPIKDPIGSNAYIYQDSQGVSYLGHSRGSHSEYKDPLYHEHSQLPTDIGAPNAIVVAPVDGIVESIVTPVETVARYGGGICDYIRLPDGKSSNDAEANTELINMLDLHPCTASSFSGKYCNSAGQYVYDPSIDDEGDFYYDGGMVVEIKDKDGNLWRLVHLKNLQVSEGEKVIHGKTVIGRVYNGTLEDEWAIYSSRPKDGGSCMSTSNPHLHFAIISSNAVSSQFYEGNTIDSTPWVKKYCNID